MDRKHAKSAWLGVVIGICILFPTFCIADEFADRVVHVFQAQQPDLHASAKSENALQVTGRWGPINVYLDNVRTACASNQEKCEGQIAAFVQRVAAVASADQSSGPISAEKVYAVLRHAGYAKRAVEGIRETDKQLVVLPFTDTMEILFVLDGENSVRFINQADLLNAGLTEKSLMGLAAANSEHLAPLKFGPVKGSDGIYFMPANDGLGTARAFDMLIWDKLEATFGGALAVAMPTRDWIFFTRADQPENVAKMRLLAARIVRGEPYPVSATVLVRESNAWQALHAP